MQALFLICCWLQVVSSILFLGGIGLAVKNKSLDLNDETKLVSGFLVFGLLYSILGLCVI